jgi:putative glutamine amidotransferase
MSPVGSRPLIGLSAYRQTTAWWGWERDAALVPGAYLDVVQSAGGQPVLIPPPGDDVANGVVPGGADGVGAGLSHLVAALDGLVLIGGGDVDAQRYGQAADPRNGGTNRLRDELELGLVAAVLDHDLPVLAVCRGMQVLNVALGGDLVQQVPDLTGTKAHQPGPGAFGPVSVVTEPDTRVRHLLGGRTEVLCSHHQAVGTLGRGLVVTARSEDGIIEAVELPGHRFVVGVQWHPEETGDARLFEALVAATLEPAAGPGPGTPTSEELP